MQYRTDFKILLLTYKTLNGLAPSYLQELLAPYLPNCTLRSQDAGLLVIPRVNKSNTGGRAFSCRAPKLWNALPSFVREAGTVTVFKSRLKTHFYKMAFLS